jgi:hypothetical protein
MHVPYSGYIYLRVRDKRFVGSLSAFTNIILPSWQLQKNIISFSIPVSHMVRNGIPNKFPPVIFTRQTIFQLIDQNDAVLRKPIRLYVAQTSELLDAHLELLTFVILNNGCCVECGTHGYELNKYRL